MGTNISTSKADTLINTKVYLIYILECCDGTFYTGITNDLNRRMNAHNSGKGAKYVRSRLPFKLVYTEISTSRGVATKREREIKSKSRSYKSVLISQYSENI